MSQESAQDEARRIAQAATSESCAALLGELSALLRRFVAMTHTQSRVVALWTVHTHVIAAAEATPYLAVTSAEKRSGKTRLLEVLELLVARPWFTGRTTAAVLPRKIHAEAPTLLLDESDAAFSGDKEYAEALRGVLNTGHRRGGKATVCTGQGANISFQDFSTFSAKAIAGIGKLPDTVADRAIPIRLERRAPGERVDRFRRREAEPQAQQLRHRLGALADVAQGLLTDARPSLPEELNDRAWDAVEPLLAIAELAGGDWPVAARAACVELYGGRQLEDESTGIRLLSDIRETFSDDDRITTTILLDRLNDLDEAPWGDWFGKPLTHRGLAKLLKPFAIRSRQVRLEEGTTGTKKGFHRDQFAGAWDRYLPANPASIRHPDTTQSQSRIEPDIHPRQERDVSDNKSPTSPPPERDVSDVSDFEGCAPEGLSPEGRTSAGLELEARAMASADDESSRFIRAETEELGRPADWTDEAAADFITKATTLLPGSTEEAGSVWRPRPGSGIDPTPAQCADPAERTRLWREHGVKWFRTPPAATPVPTIPEAELPAWMSAKGYDALEAGLTRAAKDNRRATAARDTISRSDPADQSPLEGGPA